MPQTFVIAAEFDPLYSDATNYYEKIKQIGANGSDFLKVDGVVHPFLMLEDLCKEECEAVYVKISEFCHSLRV